MALDTDNVKYQINGLYGISGFVGSQEKKDMTADILLEYAQRGLESATPEAPVSCVLLK